MFGYNNVHSLLLISPTTIDIQKWFDGEGLEKLNLRNELFKKFKRSRRHIDKELHKKSKYDALKLIF